MQPSLPGPPASSAAWPLLRDWVHARTGAPGPLVGGPGVCASCRGPARRGCARCFHCQLHTETAPGLLADLVAPAAYAVKGGEFARDLWLYKSARPGAAQARANLLALTLVFLHDQGPALWARAGLAAPTHACVVPSGRGRPGPHPLRALLTPYLRLRWAELITAAGGGAWGRLLDPGRYRVRALPAAPVLLLDDTWVSGGSAQSAAVALKQAGARSVALVVLGRHVAPGPGWPCRPAARAPMRPPLPSPANRLEG
jgi:hypothetical protein